MKSMREKRKTQLMLGVSALGVFVFSAPNDAVQYIKEGFAREFFS